jgi:Staphylococcal nuclease homologue
VADQSLSNPLALCIFCIDTPCLSPQALDNYGHTVAEVYAGGRKVNLELARMGLAYAYR